MPPSLKYTICSSLHTAMPPSLKYTSCSSLHTAIPPSLKYTTCPSFHTAIPPSLKYTTCPSLHTAIPPSLKYTSCSSLLKSYKKCLTQVCRITKSEMYKCIVISFYIKIKFFSAYSPYPHLIIFFYLQGKLQTLIIKMKSLECDQLFTLPQS